MVEARARKPRLLLGTDFLPAFCDGDAPPRVTPTPAPNFELLGAISLTKTLMGGEYFWPTDDPKPAQFRLFRRLSPSAQRESVGSANIYVYDGQASGSADPAAAVDMDIEDGADALLEELFNEGGVEPGQGVEPEAPEFECEHLPPPVVGEPAYPLPPTRRLTGKQASPQRQAFIPNGFKACIPREAERSRLSMVLGPLQTVQFGMKKEKPRVTRRLGQRDGSADCLYLLRVNERGVGVFGAQPLRNAGIARWLSRIPDPRKRHTRF